MIYVPTLRQRIQESQGELTQLVKLLVERILLTGGYKADLPLSPGEDAEDRLVGQLREGTLSADELLAGYSALLYRRHGSYAEVAKRTGLDPRTSRKYVLAAKAG